MSLSRQYCTACAYYSVRLIQRARHGDEEAVVVAAQRLRKRLYRCDGPALGEGCVEGCEDEAVPAGGGGGEGRGCSSGGGGGGGGGDARRVNACDVSDAAAATRSSGAPSCTAAAATPCSSERRHLDRVVARDVVPQHGRGQREAVVDVLVGAQEGLALPGSSSSSSSRGEKEARGGVSQHTSNEDTRPRAWHLRAWGPLPPPPPLLYPPTSAPARARR